MGIARARVSIIQSHKHAHADLDSFLFSTVLELQNDLLIRTHLALLYDTLLEQNLVRVIEPYSVVDLNYVAAEVGQPLSGVEAK